MSVQELIDALAPIAAVSPDYEVVIEPYQQTVVWRGCGETCCGNEENISKMEPVRIVRGHLNKAVYISTGEIR